MINRRLLRIKALQALYAHSKNTDKSISAAESELKNSIDKAYQLYLLHFKLLANFQVRAQMRYEQLLSLPIKDKVQIAQFEHFSKNSFFIALTESTSLSQAFDEYPISWDENDQYTSDLFKQFVASDEFAQFLDKENSFSSGKKLATKYFNDTLLVSDDFHQHIEEINVYWNDDITFVFQMVEKTIRKSKDEENGFTVMPIYSQLEDETFVLKLLRKTIANFNNYDDKIRSLSKNWEFERIPEMDLLLIKMGITEGIEFNNVPIKVSLNEYVELAKFYSSIKSKQFVNGILDRIYKEYIDNGTIKKVGRGLI